MARRQTELKPEDTSSWLVEELKGITPPAPDAEGGTETAEDWTAPGLPPGEGLREEAPEAGDGQPADDPALTEELPEPAPASGAESDEDGDALAAQSAGISEVRMDVEHLQADVEVLKAQVGEILARLDEFAERLEGFEAESASRRADAQSSYALLSVLHRGERPAEPEPGEDRLDLGAATFEDLRQLGCSATQAARLLTYRDAYGFDSIERIRELPGIPDRLFERLRTRLTV